MSAKRSAVRMLVRTDLGRVRLDVLHKLRTAHPAGTDQVGTSKPSIAIRFEKMSDMAVMIE